MRGSRVLSVGAIATAAVVAFGSTTAAGAAPPVARGTASATPVLTGLTGNKAVATGLDLNILLGTAADDGTGLLQKYQRYGRNAGSLTTLAALPAAPADVAPAGFRNVWVLFGASEPPAEEPPTDSGEPAPSTSATPADAADPGNKLYKWDARSGDLQLVADLGAYAAAHPDPFDQENNDADSNAYGLAALFDGSVLVADAAANAVRRVWPDGTIKTVVQLMPETVSTDNIPPDPANPLPPTLDAEAVPTSVALGPDGYWYVGELKGFPFHPGTSRVWRIRPGTTDAICNPTAPDQGACKTYADGLTSIIDITGDFRGNLNVLEIAKDGVGALEAANPEDPASIPPSALIRISRDGTRTELAPGQIFVAGGVTPDFLSKSLFVTDFQLVPGLGRLLKVG